MQGVRTQETRQQQGRGLRPAGAEALHPSLLFPPAAPPARRPPRVTLLRPGDLHHAQALQVPRCQGLSQTSQLGEFTSSRIRHVPTHSQITRNVHQMVQLDYFFFLNKT